jgi:hypothetical protein
MLPVFQQGISHGGAKDVDEPEIVQFSRTKLHFSPKCQTVTKGIFARCTSRHL